MTLSPYSLSLRVETEQNVKPLNPSKMTDLLKDCRKAVNQAKYLATASRKQNALTLLAKLTEEVSNLKEVKPKAKKTSKKSKSKAKSKTAKLSKSKLAKLTKAELVAMLSA